MEKWEEKVIKREKREDSMHYHCRCGEVHARAVAAASGGAV